MSDFSDGLGAGAGDSVATGLSGSVLRILLFWLPVGLTIWGVKETYTGVPSRAMGIGSLALGLVGLYFYCRPRMLKFLEMDKESEQGHAAMHALIEAEKKNLPPGVELDQKAFIAKMRARIVEEAKKLPPGAKLDSNAVIAQMTAEAEAAAQTRGTTPPPPPAA